MMKSFRLFYADYVSFIYFVPTIPRNCSQLLTQGKENSSKTPHSDHLYLKVLLYDALSVYISKESKLGTRNLKDFLAGLQTVVELEAAMKCNGDDIKFGNEINDASTEYTAHGFIWEIFHSALLEFITDEISQVKSISNIASKQSTFFC